MKTDRIEVLLKSKYRFIALVPLLIMQSTECQTAGSIEQSVAINGATVSVSATSFREYESMDKLIHLRNESATTNEVKELTYQDRIREVSKIAPLAGNRLGIFGELSRGGNQIAVVDLDSMSLVSQTHSFEYEISPSGRYIVFRSWCPKMGLPDFRFSVIMGLDVMGAKSINEEGEARVDPVQLYPSPERYTPTDPVPLEERVLFLSPMLWSESGERVYFMTYDHVSGIEALIGIDLSVGLQATNLLEREIDPYSIREVDKMTEETRSLFSRKPWVTFLHIFWKDADTIGLIGLPADRKKVFLDVSEWEGGKD